MFDNLDLSILNDLSELQMMLERSPEGGEARWQALQGWLKEHRNIKRYLEDCTRMTPEAATDHLFSELAFEMIGMKISPRAIKLAYPKVYDEWRPKIEKTVGMVLELYKQRATQKGKKKLKGGKG